MIDNFIGVFDDAFSHEFCDTAMQYFDRCEQNSLVINNNHNKLERDDKSLMWNGPNDFVIDFKRWDYLGTEFMGTMGNMIPRYYEEFPVLGECNSSLYDMKFKKAYPGGGFHKWHYDNRNFLGSHRFLVVLVYLNDNFEGGETEFLYLNKRIQPQKGRMIVWPAAFTHTHRGNPPLTSPKYTIGSWVQYQDT